MAAISGKNGLVQYGGAPVLRINNWSADIAVDDLDVTSWTTGTDQWRARIAGLSGVSGSFSGFWDAHSGGSTAQVDLQTNVLTPATGTLILEADKVTGGKYSMDVVLTGQNVSVSIDGTADVSWDFVSNGTVTFSTTT